MNFDLSDERLVVRDADELLIDETFISWLSDPEVNYFLEVRHEVPTLETQRALVKKIIDSDDVLYLFLLAKPLLEFIGTATLRLKRNYLTAELGIMIGEKSYWGKGLGKTAIDLITTHVFSELDIRKITAGVYSRNVRSLNAFLKAGFTIEGVLKQQVIGADGVVDDELRLALFPGSVNRPLIAH